MCRERESDRTDNRLCQVVEVDICNAVFEFLHDPRVDIYHPYAADRN